MEVPKDGASGKFNRAYVPGSVSGNESRRANDRDRSWRRDPAVLELFQKEGSRTGRWREDAGLGHDPVDSVQEFMMLVVVMVCAQGTECSELLGP